MGLMKPTRGRITLNGIDVSRIPHSEKRKLFGYVDQSFPLVKGTIGDQISLLDPTIQREQILRALEFVELKDTILNFPQGIDTPVINDTLFSQGQKQLLAIARAIVTDPPLLLLDEITANLDSITEAKIHNVIQRATHSHTILSISHRLTSMLDCDTIVVLEKGRIAISGSPKDLLATNEWYRTQITLESLTWN